MYLRYWRSTKCILGTEGKQGSILDTEGLQGSILDTGGRNGSIRNQGIQGQIKSTLDSEGQNGSILDTEDPIRSLTSPLKLFFCLLYKVVTISQNEWNSGMTKSLRKILTSKGRFPSRTCWNWLKSRFNVSRPTFLDLGLNFSISAMTSFSLGSVKGRIPVWRISYRYRIHFTIDVFHETW